MGVRIRIYLILYIVRCGWKFFMLTICESEPSPGIAILERPKPEPAADLVLVRVDSAGICGSDIHIYEWTDGYQFIQKHFPLVLGHEFSGVVEQNGPQAQGRFRPGQAHLGRTREERPEEK